MPKAMKKTLFPAVIIFASFYATTGLAQLGNPIQSDAQASISGPSLEETQKWIKEELEKHKGGKSYGRDVMHKVYFEECDAIYIQAEKENWGWHYDLAYKFSLAHITATIGTAYLTKNDEHYYSPSIHLQGLNKKEAFIKSAFGIEGENALPADRLEKELQRVKLHPRHSFPIGPSIYVESTVLAERLINALDHARRLCQNIELKKSTEQMKNEYKKNSKKPGDLF